MRRHTILIAAVVPALIILGSGIYVYQSNSGSPENLTASSTFESLEQAKNPGAGSSSDAAGPSVPGDERKPEANSTGKERSSFGYSNETTKPSSIAQIQGAFSGDASVLEAFDRAGREEGWGYDGLVKNLLYWEGLCNAPDPQISQLGSPDNEEQQVVREKVNKFCADFPSDFSQQSSDYAKVSFDETTRGTNDWSDRLRSVEDLGPDGALRLAISDLDNALYLGNYGQIADIVWFVGTSDLLKNALNVNEDISSMFSDARVMIAASAGIYCARFGYCGPTHPVTLGLCFQFTGRQCSNPRNLYHAAEQILTGRELLAFNRMHQELLSLVNQHRQGKF